MTEVSSFLSKNKDLTKPLIVWCFYDDKPGHQNQTAGLIQALAKEINIKVVNQTKLSWLELLKILLIPKRFLLSKSNQPHWVVGAGHGTHLSLLMTGFKYKAKKIVLMKPSLPRPFFDMCFIPEHDDVKLRDNIFITQGVLNKIEPSKKKLPSTGLILLGGESKHYQWDDEKVLLQIQLILKSYPHIDWQVSNSRRTPNHFLEKLKNLQLDHLQVFDYRSVESNWLVSRLKIVGQAWVTEDSVSMIYEVLTANTKCGLIQLQKNYETRISKNVQKLIDNRYVLSMNDFQLGHPLIDPPPLNEAERVAKYLVEKWINN